MKKIIMTPFLFFCFTLLAADKEYPCVYDNGITYFLTYKDAFHKALVSGEKINCDRARSEEFSKSVVHDPKRCPGDYVTKFKAMNVSSSDKCAGLKNNVIDTRGSAYITTLMGLSQAAITSGIKPDVNEICDETEKYLNSMVSDVRSVAAEARCKK